MTANTANMDVPSNPPSDISHISETQMTPIDTSKIKTEPSEELNVSCDIIVIDSDSEDSILISYLKHPPLQKSNPPTQCRKCMRNSPSDDEQNNEGQPDSGN